MWQIKVFFCTNRKNERQSECIIIRKIKYTYIFILHTTKVDKKKTKKEWKVHVQSRVYSSAFIKFLINWLTCENIGEFACIYNILHTYVYLLYVVIMYYLHLQM